MNKPILFFVGMVLALNSMGQQVAPTQPAATVAPTATEPKVAVTLGVFNGGGGLVGADIEFMLTERVSLQLGAGLPGFGAGINYHLKQGIRSSMINPSSSGYVECLRPLVVICNHRLSNSGFYNPHKD